MCKQFQVSLNIVQQLLVKKVSVYSFKLFTCQIPLFVLSKKQNVVLVMAYVSWTRHSHISEAMHACLKTKSSTIIT